VWYDERIVREAIHTLVSGRGTLRTYSAVLAVMVLLAVVLACHAVVVSPAWEIEVMQGLQSSSPAPLYRTAQFMTAIGHSPWYLMTALVPAGVLVAARRPGLSLLLVGAVALRTVSPIIKDIVDRPRPSASAVDVANTLGSSSFPSGHVLGATLLYGCMIYAVEVCVPNYRLRRALQGVLLMMIGLMGYARMELGEHYPTDVMGGWVIGALLLAGLVAIHRVLTLRGPAIAALVSRR
jgi:undecaprenyl-diphosphatase